MNKKNITLLLLFVSVTLFAACNQKPSKTKEEPIAETKETKKKILFVVTSHDKMGDTGQATGYHLGEVSHPWSILYKAGYEIDFTSPKGGKAPVTALDLSDSINKVFWENKDNVRKLENTLKPSEVIADNYSVIYYAGGHGTMWDFPNNKELATIAKTIYENNGIVSAICHGPAGLVNIKLTNGEYLVAGKKINSFSNKEEIKAGLNKIVPFMLETKLVEHGAKFESSEPWESHVTIDQRVITGQNPQSAIALGKAILEELNN